MLARRPATVALALACAAAAAVAAPAQAAPVDGAPGVGDRLLPNAGNGGYDVGAYDVRLHATPATGRLTARAIIRARALVALRRLDLDLRGLTVRSIAVDGRAARWRRAGQELVITPARALRAGAVFTVDVRYGGTPRPIADPDGSADGWQPTDDGVFVAGEPQGAPTWFPANDTPSDKAVLTVTATVPRGLAAIGNGRLLRRTDRATTSTFSWRTAEPLATYLATITIGRFAIRRSTVLGRPSVVAYDPRELAAAQPVLARLPEVLAWEVGRFGPYPFADVGAIVDHAPGVGYALETQTRPLFDAAPDLSTLVHELAHQWFGDSVTPRAWQDVWLNEGFATYAEWLWGEDHGGAAATAVAATATAAHPDASTWWCLAPDALGTAADLFSDQVYIRGALALDALRTRLGDDAFFGLLRDWTAAHRHGGATTADFVAAATAAGVSAGHPIDDLLHDWLTAPARPGSSTAPTCSSRARPTGAAPGARPRRG